MLLSRSFSCTNSNSNLVVNLCILWSCCFKRQTVLLCENRHDNANRLSNLIRTTIKSEQSKSQRQNVRFRKFNFFSYDIFLSFTKWWFLIIMLDRCKINLSDSKRHNSSHWSMIKHFTYNGYLLWKLKHINMLVPPNDNLRKTRVGVIFKQIEMHVVFFFSRTVGNIIFKKLYDWYSACCQTFLWQKIHFAQWWNKPMLFNTPDTKFRFNNRCELQPDLTPIQKWKKILSKCKIKRYI